MSDDLIERVFAKLEHGDVKHRAWLKAELHSTFAALVQPHIEARREDAARAALEAAAESYEAEADTWKAWPQAGAAKRKGAATIRAIDPAQFRGAGHD